MFESSFLFVTYDPAIAPFIKQELALNHPELKPSFMRSGFLTLKSPKPCTPNIVLNLAFAKVFGISLGVFKSKEELLQKLETLQPTCVHFFSRHTVDLNLGLRKKLNALYPETTPHVGDVVLDIIQVEAEEYWLGCHVHSLKRSPFPGGFIAIKENSKAPSRAYYKIEEAIESLQIPLRRHDKIIDFGSAPGGVSYALLKRGLDVIGMDPAAMDKQLLQSYRNTFKHLKRAIQDVRYEDIPQQVAWYAVDVNLEPEFVLTHLKDLVRVRSTSLLGLMITFKLANPTRVKHIKDYVQFVKEMGFKAIRVVHLPSSAKEIFVYGLTDKGLKRLTDASHSNR